MGEVVDGMGEGCGGDDGGSGLVELGFLGAREQGTLALARRVDYMYFMLGSKLTKCLVLLLYSLKLDEPCSQNCYYQRLLIIDVDEL